MAGTYEAGEAGTATGTGIGPGDRAEIGPGDGATHEAAIQQSALQPAAALDGVVAAGDGAVAGDDPTEAGGMIDAGPTGAGSVIDDGPILAGEAGDLAAETAELIGQIRQLAAHDPAGVQQVIADVLAALDRVTDGAVSEQLPEGSVLAGGGTADAN